jgi:hypothetical protein
MARSFDKETPVLLYGTRRGSKGPWAHAHPGSPNERAWLLWPAWAFRVVAPQLQRRRINVLQQAVLGILRASRLTAVEIGQRLGIHAELAAFVASELQIQGRVDAQWNVTKTGIELLDDEEELATLVPGWVFRDPWRDSLWPFVAASLEYARTERNADGYPVLDLGTTGKPWTQSAWMQFASANGDPVPPDAREIIRAAVRHGRLIRRARRLDAWGDDGEPSSDLGRFNIDRVSSIETEPQPVFLVTYLYVPRDGSESGIDWHACDFFGRGSSPPLRQLITQVARTDEGLFRVLDRLMGRTIYGGFEEFKRATAAREHRAQVLLERTLTLDIRRHGVSEPLADALAAWVEVTELGDASPMRRRREVLGACRRALERLFREIARTWPLAGIADRLSRDGVVNRARLQRAATLVGFTEVPEAFLGVTQHQVRSVAEYGKWWRLRPVVAATVLRAENDAGHPMWSAARELSDLLCRIDRVARQAGEAAHDGDEPCHPHGAPLGAQNPDFDLAAVKACLDSTLAVVGVLLGLPARSIHEEERDE